MNSHSHVIWIKAVSLLFLEWVCLWLMKLKNLFKLERESERDNQGSSRWEEKAS